MKVYGHSNCPGSLGQGMSVAIGLTGKETQQGQKYCLQPAWRWRIARGSKLGGTFRHEEKVDNLIATIDLNGKQIDGAQTMFVFGRFKSKN